jgi:hypothetical protein
VSYIQKMQWEVEFTDEFEDWWETLSAMAQSDIESSVELLEAAGPNLAFPHTSGVAGSKHGHMRELRVQHKGSPIRIFYAFDPRRISMLLIGGDKTGKDRFYKEYVPIADRLYDEHLIEIKQERERHGKTI